MVVCGRLSARRRPTLGHSEALTSLDHVGTEQDTLSAVARVPKATNNRQKRRKRLGVNRPTPAARPRSVAWRRSSRVLVTRSARTVLWFDSLVELGAAADLRRSRRTRRTRGCGRWRRSGRRRRRRTYVACRRRRWRRSGVRNRRARGGFGSRTPRISPKTHVLGAKRSVSRRPITVAVFRRAVRHHRAPARRSTPSPTPAGCPTVAESVSAENSRMVSAALYGRVRASVEVRATCPSIDGPDRSRGRLDHRRERLGAPPGAQNSSFSPKSTLTPRA